MSDDLVSLGGFLLSLFFSGFAAGFLVHSLRRLLDQV